MLLARLASFLVFLGCVGAIWLTYQAEPDVAPQTATTPASAGSGGECEQGVRQEFEQRYGAELGPEQKMMLRQELAKQC